ncbi:putative AAA+ superfamily ATPase [Natronocella acetinitrilica]|uniref:AAA+ superfamily ATPase n=1 Tax=Natronocella acetinitrilica TaxID=414046 RepID=A0AAE3KB01_9GAMM|nr:ATP-binding protein [Natronocella acetinitrilica]MCP1674061.1 putative AAA+ superfamily ATPase [Natronocella acetinitrilica]
MAFEQQLLDRLDQLLARVDALVPGAAAAPDWDASIAFRWRRGPRGGALQPVRHPHALSLDKLRNVDRQKLLLERNTRQFIAELPANNALLWGSRGTGKSSLVKALLNRYAADGLRLIEVDKSDLVDLADIADLVWDRPERFLVFCDDLSFEAGDPSYKALKAMLDGSVSAAPDNLLIYATSNRRHLLPEYMTDNAESRNVDGEIHHGEAVEEKISLSERFGLWVSFHPFSQDSYLDIVWTWLEHFGTRLDDPEAIRAEALRYALARGSRSGRVAWQFARDWAGRSGLGEG